MPLLHRDSPYPHWEFTAAAAADGASADRLLVVPERGGLISGWRCNGVERLYLDQQRFADPSQSVRGGIPVLFPICGGLPGDRLPIPQAAAAGGALTGDQTSYPMAQHGFARDLPWQLDPLADGRGVQLTLADSEASRRHFPFAFRLTLAVRLEPSALAITATLANTGDQPLPFSLGLHPYFRVSSLAAARIEGLPARCLDQARNSEAATQERLAQLAAGVDLLAGPVTAVSLVDPAGPDGAGPSRLTLETTAPLDLAVVWSDPPRPMVCLEPWTAPRQALISGDRRLELAPAATTSLQCRYRVSDGAECSEAMPIAQSSG
jgi:galactose mutarotase-like enzyme